MLNGHPGLAGDCVINYVQLWLAPDDRDGIVAPGVSSVIDALRSRKRQGHNDGSVKVFPGTINDGVGPRYHPVATMGNPGGLMVTRL